MHRRLRNSIYRWLWRIAIGSGLMLVGAGVALFFLYRAATAPVPAYQAVLEKTFEQAESGELEQSRQELESQLAALYSDAASESRWETVITATQANSWLATQLVQDFPELEDQGVTDLRVILQPDVATLAMHADLQGLQAVVTLDLQPFVTEDGQLAIELAGAKIGAAPLPVAQILDQLNASMGDEGLPWRFGRNNGNPVLLIDFEQQASSHRQVRSLDTVEAREGEIYVAGETKDRPPRVAKLAD